MIIKLLAIIQGTADGEEFSDDKEQYLYLILNIAILYAVLAHVGLLFIDCILKQWHLALIDTLFIGLHCVGFVLVKQRRYAAAGLVLGILVILFTFLTMLTIGAGHSAQYYFFVVLLMQLLIPYARLWVRGLMAGALWLSIFGYLVAGIWYTPPVLLESDLPLAVYNINLLFFGIVLIVYVDSVVRDYVAKLHKEEMIRYQQEALTDPLTGLGNRRSAENLFTLLREEKLSGQWCVAMLDIDDFKRVNDTYGHAVGDDVLKHLACCIQSTLRTSDYIYRWGGEEFLVVLSHVELAVCLELMERLRENVEKHRIPLEGTGEIGITITIGAAELDKKNIEKALQLSDELLYKGKQQGKNCVVGT